MKISEINLKKITKEKLLSDLQSGVVQVPSSKEKKEIFKKIESGINSGDYLTTRNSLIIGLYFDCSSTLESIRRKGLFRYSKYVVKKCIIKNIALELLEIGTSLGCISTNQVDYLNSVINYSTILDSYKAIDQLLLKEIREFESKYKGNSLIKTLLSFIDFLFLSNFYPQSIDDLMDFNCRSKEEISSAVSYIIYFYSERAKHLSIDTRFVSEEYIKSGDINKIIVATCSLLDFKEFEILIDHFDYRCVKYADRLKIEPPFEAFERSIQLGYIRTQIQQLNDFVEPKDVLSIEDVVEEISKQKNLVLFRFVETGGYSRYRVEMPEPLFDVLSEKFIKPDTLFKEEVVYLSSIFKELLLTHSDLSSIKLKEELTILDFMKARRIFLLFYILFAKEIYKKEKIDTPLLFRSLIPVYPEELFYNLLEKVLPIDKVDSFLDLICWEPDLEIVFDLQYQPVLYINHHFLISLSILSNSNTIRNLYAAEYKQQNQNLTSDGSFDPLVNRLSSHLTEANLINFSETNIGNTDIDIFAVFENTLFVFECKHTLHPVSPYDLRTTYDYIKKAETQLDKVNNAFKDGNLLILLEQKYQIDLKDVKNLQCCIVLSNRLFNGNIFKYPVRNINEIDNMLNRGTMRTEHGKFWLWREKKLTLEFLLDYFSLNNKLIELLYKSLSKKNSVYKLANPMIEHETYSLKFDIAKPMLKEFTDNLEKVENS